MASIYDEPINKHVDWGGDASTGNQPVSGRQVQNFIKTGLESKVGDTYYDSITGLYLQFADAENREIYLTDRITYADLLLGSFEGFAPYVVYTELVSPTEKAILYGSTGVTLDFRFQIQDSSGSPLSDGIKVVYTFNNSGSTRTATKFFNAGSGSALGVASFNVDEYLSEGTNDISVKISGRNTTASKTLVYTWTVVNLQLTTSFSVSSQIAPTDSIAIPYYIKGLGTKHVQFYIDSVLYPTEDVIADAELSKIFYIPNTWASGKHTLQIRAYMTIGSENFYSYTLYREFVISGATGKWITFAYDFTPGTLIQSDLSNLVFNEKQYEAVSINWGYIASDLLDRTINWYLDDVKVAVREGTSGVLSPLSFVPTIAKITNQDLKAYIEGETTAIDTYKMFVAENTEIREETDALGLKLSAFGKYNSDADHASWTYNGITTDFTNVEWTDLSGWNGQALVLQNGAAAQVNYKPFDSNHPAVSYGLTFEIEFETFNVDDESAVVASVATGSHGIQITSNSATLTSDAGTIVKTNFKDGEKVKLAFIINQREGVQLAHLTYIQNNGILERAVSYATNDTYTNSAFIQLGGSTQAGIKIYSIRSYYKALTTIQEFNNFAIDSNDVAAVLARNDVYIPGTTTVSVEKMQGILPVLLFTGPIHILLESTSKETTITGDFSFTNPQDPTKNWWGTGMQMKLQGTSSLRYPRKNFKIYMKKGNNPVVFDYEGNQITDWAMKARAVPCHTFTLKADFSDSSCTHNATVARLYGDLEPNVVVNGDHILRTPPQVCAYEGQFEQATGKQFPYDLRTTPDSFAMVMFYRENDSDDYTFAGQYNFLNDKGNEFVYGFRSIYANGDNPWDKTAPKLWDNVNTHCFEVLNNTDSTGLCEWTDSTLFFVEDPQNPGHSYWEQTWESRYPEAEGTETKAEMDALAQSLYQLHSWMSSCYKTPLDNPLEWGGAEAKAKFYNEQADHLDLNKCAAYYSYFMRFGAVDQVNKNMMITTYDGVHWFPIRYDNDTILGQRNDGRLIYDYTITRQSIDTETGDYAYAGHASWFWNALEAQNDVEVYPYGFMTSYVPDVDAGLYSAGLNYNATVQYFDVTTSDKWCERIYNDNGTYKYISPFIGSEHQDYLYALQGKRQSHRHWWLRNRFDLYDAKFVTGDYSSKNINFTVPGTPQGSVIILKPGKTNYYGYGINKVPQKTGVYGEKGQSLPITFTMPRQLAVGDPIYLYAANCIEELDLHQFCSHFTTFDLSGAYDETIGTKLKKLTLGDVNNPNSSNVAFSGFANMSRLEYLDISGFAGNNTFDLTGLSSLKTFIALGSGLTLFNCPAGLNFNELRLPQTVTGITMDQVTWDALHFEFTPTNTLNYVSFSRMKGANVRNFLTTWIRNIKNGGTFVGKTLNLSVPKDDPWDNMDVQMLLDFAAFDVHSIRGRFIIGRQITSEEMTALTDAFGPTIWDPNAPLVIDAVESVVIGCNKSHLYAGETAQFTAVSFPVGGIQHAVHFEIADKAEEGTPEDPIYVQGNAILHKFTGVLETTENNTPDNTFTVFAIDEVTGTADDMSYTVYRRSYPTAVAITGPTAILAIGTYEFTAVPSPAGTNGTLQSFEWFVTERPYLNVLSRTAEKLTLQVLNVPSTYDVNVVSVALTYKNGVALPANHNFIAHDKVKIVDSQSNYNLAVALNELGVSASPLLTWDIEAYLWDQILNLNDCEHGPAVTSFLGSTANRVYKYFANATKFDFNGIVNLDDQHNDIDLTNNVALTEVDFSGTALEGIVWGPALTKANIPTVKRIKVPANTVAFNTTDVTFTPEEITHIELHNSPFTQQTTYGDALNWFYFEIYKKQVPSVLPEPTSTYYCYYNSNNSILYSDSVKVTSNYYDDDIQTGLYELTDATLDRGVFESVTNPNVNHVTGIDTNCTTIYGNILAGSTSLVNFRADYATAINGEICKNCSALVTVSLLSCSAAYENYHFQNCTSLKNVFAPTLHFASGGGLNAFENSGIEVISQALEAPTAGVWLRDLTAVPTNCFKGCQYLTDAQLPKVTTVGENIFFHCIRLVSGSLASCATLGVSTFEECYLLETASKTHLTEIEFALCDNLVAVPDKCFKNCRSLLQGSFVTNTSTCNSFGEECFAGCTSLTCVFSSDESRTGIRVGINTQLSFGDKCFLGCISLESAIVNFAHSFGAYCFAGCTAVADLHTYPQAPAVQGNTFGDGTESYAYMGSETGSVNLLYLLTDHSGYNVSPWSDVVLNASKCHFQITTEQASCTITYRASYRLTDVENKPNISSVSWTPSPVPGQDGTGVIAMNVASIPGSFFDTNMSHMYLHEVSADCIQLGSWAFARCTALTTVSLTACGTLGGYCFYRSGITAFNGDNVLYLNGDSQFRECPGLITASFHNLSVVSSYMFAGCTALVNTDFNSVITINESGFNHCTSLQTVNLPACITIGNNAFYEDSALTTVNAPICTGVNYQAFMRCSSLSSFVFDNIEYIGSRDNVDGAYYDVFYGTALVDVYAPNCVGVGRRSFGACHSLNIVNLPACTAIGQEVFDASSVKEVRLPILQTPPSRLFYWYNTTSYLATVNVPALTTVGYQDFYRTYALQQELDCSHVTALSSGAFRASGLTRITHLDNITTIPDNAQSSTWWDDCGVFDGSPSLTFVDLPAQLTHIGNLAFRNCSALEDINLSTLTNVTRIGYAAFYNCNKLGSGANQQILNMPNLTTLDSIVFYNAGLTGIENLGTLTSIAGGDGNGRGVFHGCTLQYAKLPKCLKTIGSYAFAECKYLTSVNFYDLVNLLRIEWDAFGYSGNTQPGAITSPVSLPNLTDLSNRSFYRQSISSIDDLGKLTILHRPDNDYAAFRETKIRSLVVPKTMARMEYNNFRDCNQLRYITALGNTPAVVDNSTDNSTWYGCNANLKKVAVPAGFKEDYKTAWEYLTQSTFCELPYDDSEWTLVVYNFGLAGQCTVLDSTATVTNMEVWDGDEWIATTVATEITITEPGFIKVRFKSTGSVLPAIAKAEALRIWTATNILSVADSAFANAPMLSEFHGTNVTTLGVSAFSHCEFMEVMELPALTTLNDSCLEYLGIGMLGGDPVLKTLIFGQIQPVCPKEETEGGMVNPFLMIPDANPAAGFYTSHDCQTGDGWDWQGTTHTTQYYYWEYLAATRGWSHNPITINFHSTVDLEIPIAGEVTGYSYDATEQIGYITLSTATPTSNPFAGNTNVEVLWGDNQIFSLPTDFVNGCSALRYVWFPTVTTLGTGALQNATMLRTVVLPRLTAIPNDGFNGDGGLYDKIHFDRVVTVGDRAFYNCSNMHSIDLPVCTSVGTSAFENTELVSINMPALQTVGATAFKDTPAYEALLPACTTIGSNAFQNCSELITIEVGTTQPVAQANSFADTALNGTVHHNVTNWNWSADGWSYLHGRGWDEVLPYIEYVASAQLVIDEEHYVGIANHTYDPTTHTGLIVLNTKNPTCENFEGQDTVTEVTLSSVIESLPSRYFYGCQSLDQINMNLGQIPVASNTFVGVASTGMIRVFDYADWNRQAPGWDILLGPTGGWDFDNRVLYYTAAEKAVLHTEEGVEYHIYDSFLQRGAIKMTNATPTTTPLRNNVQATEIHGLFTTLPDYFVAACDAESISFPYATSVGAYALSGCSNVLHVELNRAITVGAYALQMDIKLLSCTLGAAQTIGAYAFYRDYAVSGINTSTFVSIGEKAFNQCYAITSLNSLALQTIGNYAFQNCVSLTEFVCQAPTSIGTSAFESCTSLATVTIPSGLTVLNNTVFYHCTSLTTLSFPTVTTIGNNCFDNCTSLTQCLIPSVVTIGYRAFYNCTVLVTLGPVTHLTSIGSESFYACPKLTNTFDFATVTNIGNYPFDGCYAFTGAVTPTNLQQSGNAWFFNARLTSVDFTGNTTITGFPYGSDRGTFNNEVLLQSVVIPTNLTYLGSSTSATTDNVQWRGTFGRCFALRSIGPTDWQSKIKRMSYDAFYTTFSLHLDVNMPELEFLGNRVFDGTGIVAVENLGKITRLNTYGTATNSIAYNRQLSYVKLPTTLTDVGHGFLYGCFAMRNLYVPSFTPLEYTYQDNAGAWWRGGGALKQQNFATNVPNLHEIRIPCGSYEEYYYWDEGTTADSFDYWSSAGSRQCLVEGSYEETEWHTVAYDVSGSFGQPMTIINSVANVSAMQVRELAYNPETGQYTGAAWIDIENPEVTHTFARRPIGADPERPRLDSGIRIVRYKFRSGISNEFAGITTVKRVYTPSAVLSSSAFAGCTGLVTIKVPNAQTFGTGVFTNCSSLSLIEVDAQPVASSDTFSGAGSNGVVRIYGTCDFTATGWSSLVNWTSKDRTVVRLKSVADLDSTDPRYYTVWTSPGSCNGPGLYEKGEVATLECRPGFRSPWDNVERRMYDFVAWSDGETSNPHSPITMDSDKEINAIVRDRRFRLNVVEQGASGGQFTISYPFTDENGNGYFTWDNAFTVNSVSSPSGYKFESWRVWDGWGHYYTREWHPTIDADRNATWHRNIGSGSDVITIILNYVTL